MTLQDAKPTLKERGGRPNLLDLWQHRGQLDEAGRDVRGAATYRLRALAARVAD